MPAPIPRLSLKPEEAAASLGLSRSTFDTEVLPRLRVVRVGETGKRILVPVKSLEAWLDRNAAVPLGGS